MKLIRRAAAGALLALWALCLIGAPAHAAVAAQGPTQPGNVPQVVVALDVPQFLNLLIAVVFPVLVGLVTTRVTRSSVKAVLLATISLASGFVSALLAAALAGIPFDILGALLTGIGAWIIAIATHYGFWRPTGVSDATRDVGVTTNRT